MRMELFSLADPAELEDYLLSLRDVPGYVFLKKPASGLVMVRARMGGSGRAVNIGEMLVSRCVVDLSGIQGYGFTPFEDLRHSELAAVLDALSGHPDYREGLEWFTEGLRIRALERERHERLEAAATKVEFFTVKRGEDE